MGYLDAKPYTGDRPKLLRRVFPNGGIKERVGNS